MMLVPGHHFSFGKKRRRLQKNKADERRKKKIGGQCSIEIKAGQKKKNETIDLEKKLVEIKKKMK
jgi:hypothetical protein